MNTKLYWVVVVVLVAGALTGLLREVRDPAAAYERLVEQYRYSYIKDVKGGATPRETLDMFVAALEKGDIDEALLYIDPEQRDRYEADMRAGLANGNLRLVIEDYRRISNGRDIGSGRYEFNSVSPSTGTQFSYFLVYNDLAKIWMFESI